MTIDLAKLPVNIQTVSHITPNLTLYFPQMWGMHNQHVQNNINRIIVEQVQQLIETQINSQIQGQTDMYGFYELKTNQRGVLSILQSNYAYTPPMAHGMTFASSLTFNVQTGRVYSLKELFIENSDYVQIISDLIRLQIKERDIPILNEFEGINPDQDYYIADKTLVIYFQLYELSPYYVGLPMFPISVYQLQDIMKENSPIDKMLAAI